MKPGRLSPLLAVGLFLVLFLYYLSGLSGTVPSYRDSGDLIASCFTLGIAHPPGYPAYVVLAKAFLTVVPFGNVAYRLNVFSAMGAAVVAIVLFFGVLHFFEKREWGGWETIACLSPIVVLALSPAMVSLARVAEMYTWAAVASAAVLFASRTSKPLAFFLFGIALTLHPTNVFLLPVIGAGIGCRGDLSKRTLVTMVVILLLGASVTLFLPVRSAQFPVADWGHPAAWRNFWRVITRADYGGLKLHPQESVFSWSPEQVVSQLALFLQSFRSEWGTLSLVFGVAGVACLPRLSRPERGWGIALLISFLVSGPGFVLLSNLPVHAATSLPILQPYLLLAGVLWCPFIVLSIQILWRKSPVAGLLAAFLILAFGVRSRPSQRMDFYAYDYGRSLLHSLPPRSALYDPDDPTAFTLMALQTTEMRRTDVAFLSFFRTRWGYEQLKRRYPELLPPGEIPNASELQHAIWTYSVKQRPIFADLPQKLSPVPYRAEGLVYRAMAAAAPVESSPSLRRGEESLELSFSRQRLRVNDVPDFFTQHLIGYYAAAHSNLGLEYAQARQIESARHHYREALRIDSGLAAAWNNWGVLEFNRQRPREAAELFQRAVQLDPQNAGFTKNLDLAKKSVQN